MKCRICGKEVDKIQNVLITHNPEKLFSSPESQKPFAGKFFFCDVCGHGQIENRLNEKFYDTYSEASIGNDDMKADYPEKTKLKSEYYLGVISSLKKQCKTGERILDIGCGDGSLLVLASKYFKNPIGVDPSQRASKNASEKGLNVIRTCFDNNFGERDFDSVISTQVFGYLDDLESSYRMIYEVLRPGGVGYIEIPNGRRIYESGRYYDVFSEQLNYYSTQSISQCIYHAGLYVTSIAEVHNSEHIGVYFQKPYGLLSFSDSRKKNYDMMVYVLSNHKSIGIWGAGIKGRIWVQDIAAKCRLFSKVKYIFDSNMSIWGSFIANSHVPISKPDYRAVNL